MELPFLATFFWGIRVLFGVLREILVYLWSGCKEGQLQEGLHDIITMVKALCGERHWGNSFSPRTSLMACMIYRSELGIF